MGVMAFPLLEMVKILMMQLEQQLALLSNFAANNVTKVKKKNVRKRQKAAERKESTFRHHYIQAVVNISHIDEHFGKALVTLLIINCPGNALLTVTLISHTYFSLKPLDIEVQLSIVMTMLMQFISFIVVHLLVASLNGRLKGLAKSYVSVMYNPIDKGTTKAVYDKFTFATKAVIRNDLFYASYYNKKSYGFTYLDFGHVSMFTFVKYCLLYGEALIFFFRSEMKNYA